MRLINTETLRLHIFDDSANIRYAILSHTWADGEVNFEDMQNLSVAERKSGFAKLQATIYVAKANGYQFVWIDTCCIDKSSSAELSEAINSMFRWYKEADVCFAFLFDLPVPVSGTESAPSVEGDLKRCRWFTRGWTLQELIAPRTLLFFDAEWNLRGTKMDFATTIEKITGIARSVLEDSSLLSTIPLAQRMSWAARRQTTRIEDSAYSLLGIFDINMAMIYGEGRKAFVRLQEEILKKTTDLSLFSWQANESRRASGVLAGSPAEFRDRGRVVLSTDQFRFQDEIVMTNKGVKITTALSYRGVGGLYVMDLHCYDVGPDGNYFRVGIYLERARDTYYRSESHRIEGESTLNTNATRPSVVYLLTSIEKGLENVILDKTRFRICLDIPDRYRLMPHHHIEVHDITAVPQAHWHFPERAFTIHGQSQFLCFIRFRVASTWVSRGDSGSRVDSESTVVILACNFNVSQRTRLQVNIITETNLQRLLAPNNFICPFRNIDSYGSFGDRSSLVFLCDRIQGNSRLMVSHQDSDLDYVIEAEVMDTSDGNEGIRLRFSTRTGIWTSSLLPDDESLRRPGSPISRPPGPWRN